MAPRPRFRTHAARRARTVCTLLRPASAVALGAIAGSAAAFDFATSGFEGSLDTTLSIGVQGRTQSIDSDLVGTRALSPSPPDPGRKGRAFSVNNDDGTLNYERGLFATIARFTSELDISPTNQMFGAFVRAEGYYDPTNANQDRTDHRDLSDAARDQVAKNLRLLDAYGEVNLSPFEVDTSFRGGRQVISWGESSFIPGGINVINPVDVSQLRTPGAELRNALLPQGMLSLNSAVGENVSVEGFYQYDWKRVRIDRPGTFFSTNDFVGKGQDKAMLGFGDFSEFGTDVETLFNALGLAATPPVPVPPGLFNLINGVLASPLGPGPLPTLDSFESDWFSVPRGDNKTPKDHGQGGVAVRVFVPRLNDTELGFYFMNYHSRLPIISARTADEATTETAAAQYAKLAAFGSDVQSAVAVNTQGQGSRYFVEYPEDIKLVGTSFNAQLGTTGWALQGEYSFKWNVPLQVDDVELLFASLTPLDTAVGGVLPFSVNQLGEFGPSTVINGYRRSEISQLQATATKVLGPTLGADTGVFLAELGWHFVHDLPSQSDLRMNGPGTNTSGNPFHSTAAGGHSGKAAETSDHFPDKHSLGYRLAGTLQFNNVLGGANLAPRVQWQHDFQGVSPGPGGPFLQGRKAVSLGMQATYLEKWVADVSWTGYFGAGRHNLINDRDFWSASLKYSF